VRDLNSLINFSKKDLKCVGSYSMQLSINLRDTLTYRFSDLKFKHSVPSWAELLTRRKEIKEEQLKEKITEEQALFGKFRMV